MGVQTTRYIGGNSLEKIVNTYLYMQEEKNNQVEKIHVTYSKVRQYIPREISFDKTEDYIVEALVLF